MRMQVASWASLVAQLVKNLPAMQRPGFNPWVVKSPWRRERLPIPVFWPGESHGLHSCKELDTTDRLSLLKLHLSLGVLSAVTLIGGGESRVRARCKPELHLCSVTVITLSRTVSGPKLL